MTVRNFSDQGFDDFRKERKRLQAKLGPQAPSIGYDNQALRELEQVEAREVRDQQLTREVHDFFQAATRQAASIVERVAKDALQETGARVEQEMESFLIDSLARMNTFILTVLKERRGPIAETRMEPSVGNIVGPSLDEFRFAGTAETGDKHIGQDPFDTAVDDVRREFREQVGQATGDSEQTAVPMDEHLVADVETAAAESAAAPAATAAPRAVARQAAAAASPTPPTVAPTTRTTAAVPPPVAKPVSTGDADLDRFKEALKTLVRQGMMSRDDARIAWQTRVQSMAGKG